MKAFLILLVIFLSTKSFAKVIKISAVSNLGFGTGVPGDGALVIPPSNSENASNGSFNVTGDANRAFTITLPATATLKTGTGANARSQIGVSNFKSFPINGANGLLGPSGSQMLYVGATRAALLINQVAGSYTGTYSVTVVY